MLGNIIIIMNVSSDYVITGKYKTYYKVYGDLTQKWNIPIVMIHGGPGQTHQYLQKLGILSIFTGPIVMYDQLDCGKTRIRGNNQVRILDHIIQLESLIKKLKISKFHLFGHSWGSILALEYYLKYPNKIMSIVFYSPCISIKLWQKQADIYVKNIKKKCGTKINCSLKNQYLKKHIIDKKIAEKYSKGNNPFIYAHLWGKNEWNVNGKLKNYNNIKGLKKINIPVHFIGGQFDTASPSIVKHLASKTKGATYKIFTKSRHVAHLDEPKSFRNNIIFFNNYFNEQALNHRSDYFLKIFLKKRKKSRTNVSINLITLILFKYNASKYFNEKKLENNLKQTIKDINKVINKKKITSLFSLQAIIDFWYFTKLLGYKDKFKPSDSIINKYISKTKIENIQDPMDALLMYIYIRSLTFCNNSKYKHLNKHINELIPIIKQDITYYGYYLTHVIFYDKQFGKNKNILISSKIILIELNKFCKNAFNNSNKLYSSKADLIGEIIICCKLVGAYNFPYYSKLIRQILQVNRSKDFHQDAVLAVVSCKWNNFSKIPKALSY